MIDTRLCKNKEELILSMQYEKNKALLSKHNSKIFEIQTELKYLRNTLLKEQKIIKQIKEEISNFESIYNYMIIEEGGDESYLTIKK